MSLSQFIIHFVKSRLIYIISALFNHKQAVVRDTTNLAPCCHLANATDSELWLVIKKLTFNPPTRLPELTQNLIRSFHGNSTPSLKISCKSVQPFSRNVADKKQTKKQTKKSNENNTPSPYRGRGKNYRRFYSKMPLITQMYCGTHTT